MRILVKGVTIPETIAEYQGEVILKLAGKLLGAQSFPDWIDKELAASIYYLFYLPFPQVEKESRNPLKLSLVSNLIESPSFWKIKPRTVIDRLVSIVASASLIEKIVRNLPKQGNARSEMRENDQELGDSLSRALSLALRQVEKDTRTAKEIETLVTSTIPGSTSELAFEDILEEMLYLSRKTDIAKILEKLSGVKLPNYIARKTSRYPKGWIEGVELGGDPERIHHSQLALPDELFYLLLAESRLLLYRRVFPLEEGPLYVLLDKSGSMQGAKIDWARAVTLALYQRAVREGRRFYARFFDALPHDLQESPPYPEARHVLRLLEYLGTVKAGGGTDITRALATAVSDIESGRSREVADIVLITDGEDKLSVNVLRGIIRRIPVRLHTVMIGGDNPSLRRVSESYMTARQLGEGDLVRVVDNIEKARAGILHKS